MLSRQDYKTYLEEIMAQERKAVEVYGESIGLAEDNAIKEELKKIYQEEIEHVKIVEILIDILISNKD
jgi:rubrerythrin